MPEPVVYLTQGAHVLIGPKDAWKIDDRVSIPERERPWPHSDTVPAREYVVRLVEPDGLAWAIEDKEQAA